MGKKAKHGRCPLCGKDYEDPLLYSHRCNPVENKADLNDSGVFEKEKTYGERLDDGFFLMGLAGDNQ